MPAETCALTRDEAITSRSGGSKHDAWLRDRLHHLRIELLEEAFTLERHRQWEAADVAIAAAARLGGLMDDAEAAANSVVLRPSSAPASVPS